MSPRRDGTVSRRQLLAGSGLAAAGVAAGIGIGNATAGAAAPAGTVEPFYGTHQAGITTPPQNRLVFATYDVTDPDRSGVATLLAAWSAAAARMTAGRPVDADQGPAVQPPDTGEAFGLDAARLTLTIGFGPTLFDGRFGLADRRPAALSDLPAFAGDALEPERTGGDLCIQACADDAQVAFHAVHNLTRIGLGSVTLRNLQVGFGRTASEGGDAPTPRNLLGFKDGTANLDPTDAGSMGSAVWVDDPGDQSWMSGGTYLVARRIRVHLEAWDRNTLGAQERTIGRQRASGAPLGGTHEHDPLDLTAVDGSGAPRIPDDAHVRLAAAETNHGAVLLRRGYGFADGMDPSTGELDCGLFFISFQRDPAAQFVPIQRRLASQDALSEYLLHTGSGLFACPTGPAPERPWGHGLF